MDTIAAVKFTMAPY